MKKNEEEMKFIKIKNIKIDKSKTPNNLQPAAQPS